ncbi:unnamed protein product [Chrysodeixis includens]|uniref:Uncharacterized protein n=1 Tax=Chrysodeixis includens TaxID=689277 RepID=A0A9N8PWX3_CHRIL|nr:unnamed protein product [Chrysodeixis includens]
MSSPQTALRPLHDSLPPPLILRYFMALLRQIIYWDTYLWSPPSSGARGHSCLGLRTGVSPHFSTNSMRAMVAAQRQCVIGSELVRCSGDAAERPAGPRRPPAGSWRAPRPPPYSRAMPAPWSRARASPRYSRSSAAPLLILS